MSYTDYFNRIYRSDVPRGYRAHTSRYPKSTLVLYSKETNTPLAALILLPDNNVIISRTDNAFQSVFSEEGKAFSFAIINLSDTYINFNILHREHSVDTVNPGADYGVNKVNELRKFEAFLVRSDQRTDKEMILKALTTGKDEYTRDVTVDECEKKDSKYTALKFFLSVVPDVKSRKEVLDKYREGTYWDTASFVVLDDTVSLDVPSYISREQYIRNIRTGEEGGAFRTLGVPAFYTREMYIREQREELETAEDEEEEDDSRYHMPDLGTCRFFSTNSGGSSAPSFGSDGSSSSSNPSSSSSSNYSRKKSVRSNATLGRPASLEVHTLQSNSLTNPGRATAGRLDYGTHVNVNTCETGNEYEYTLASEPTSLTLSIHAELFKNMREINTEELLKEYLNSLKDASYKDLIKKLKGQYKSEFCCIDLESPADTVIAQCGHQCINHENVSNSIKTCPMCRSPVLAFIPESALEDIA